MFQEEAGMAEPHVVSALRNMRSELGGVVNQLEHRLEQHRADLARLVASMRMLDLDILPAEVRPMQQGARSA